MFVHNKFLYQTGTLIYENTQNLQSGFVTYATPYRIETGVKFAVADRHTDVKQTEESNRFIIDEIFVQFGWEQISGIISTGMNLKVGRTRLVYDGEEYRATNVNDFGQKYNKKYMPMGVIEVKFERRVPINV